MPAASGRRLVALDLPPGEAFLRALDAAWAEGDAVVPLDPGARPDVRTRVQDALRFEIPAGDDVALVITTSGSTGEPKGVQLSAAALAASARATVARLHLSADDVWLSCLPWHHIGGLQVALRARLSGAGLLVHERFDVDRFAAERRPTVTSLVPTQLVRLLDAGVDLTGYGAVLLGGAAASPDLLARATEAGVPVVRTYGMSETAGGCVYDGVPLDGVEVRVDDDARIWLRGPVLTSGYRLRPDLTAAALVDGWLRTEDRGELDLDGRLSVLGRLDDVVVTGGENVDLSAVEVVVAAHPALRDVAVTSVPDVEWGERVVVVAVPAPGTSTTAVELRAWCADRLPAPAVPRDLLLVPALPLLASGKLDRLAVRALAHTAEGRARPRQSSDPPSSR